MPISVALHSPTPVADDSPVVALLLHGYGSNERDLPGLAPWLPPHLPWASVRAPLPMGPAAAWFPITMPDEPVDADYSSATADLWDWIDSNVPAQTQVVPIGFSQGGAMALQLLRTRPERIAATVVLAGFTSRDTQPADAQLARDRPPVFWGRGDADPIIWQPAIEHAAEFLARHSTLTAKVYPGLAHSVSPTEMDDVRAFLDEHLPGAP